MSVIAGTLALISLLIVWLTQACLLGKLRAPRPSEPAEFPGVSVLKPLKGVDEGLYENLAAMARQDYPEFEVLFCAESADDPALAIARQVQRDFPGTRIRVFSGANSEGLNPKVRVLRRLLPVAQHDWLLVSDSNVRPGPHYLRELAACQAASGAALVHNLLCGVGERSAGARLENVQMNSWIAASIAFCDAGGHPCVIGKSMFMRRSALLQVGGFEGVKDILAEDYILGSRFFAAGLGVELCAGVLPVISGARDTLSFVNRHVRWGQMRRRIAPGFFLGEIMAHPVLFLLLWALTGPGWLAPVSAGALGLAKWLVDAYVYARLQARPSLPTLAYMPLKDLLMPLLWLAGGLKTRVSWRGNEMRVGAGSRLFPVADGSIDALPERA